MDRIVLQVRNSAAHMGLVNHMELRRAVVIMTAVVEDLMAVLGCSRNAFWRNKEIQLIADGMLDKAASEMKRIVDAKLAAARLRLERLTQNLDEASARAVLATLSGGKGTYADYEEPHECPVCHQQGWLICGVRSEEEAEYSEDGDLVYGIKSAWPFEFECLTCGLGLEYGELYSFEFPRYIVVEDEEDVSGSTYDGE